jgi:beta-lactam-binding protein with PASTA domain
MRVRTATSAAGVILGIALLAGCGGATPAAPVTVTVPAPAVPAAPATAEIPDLKGQNGAIAESTLKGLGFTNLRLAADAASGRSLVALPENWTVTKVEPKPGTQASTSQLVVVTMTK